MGEAPAREDGTVTRSAEVRLLISVLLCIFSLFIVYKWVSSLVKYVGSFPVEDRCLDDQMEQLHTELKSLKVSGFFFADMSSLTTAVTRKQCSVFAHQGCKRRRSVSLKFSVRGVKMYNEDETVSVACSDESILQLFGLMRLF